MQHQTTRNLMLASLLAAIVLAVTTLILLIAVGGTLTATFFALTLLAVVAMVVFAVLSARSRSRAVARVPTARRERMVVEKVEPSQQAYYDFKGDIHPVIDIEGIGPTYAKRLEEIGVTTTARLCYEDADGLAGRIDAPATTVRHWQDMAQLAKVHGIGKQYAEALVRSGVRGIDDLKNRKAEAIAADVSRYLSGLDSKVLGQAVSEKRVATWQREAAGMRRVRQPVPEA